MKVADSFKLSLNNILHRRLRAWLTLLGIIIGVAAVVSIISIGEGAQTSINQQLSGFGADIITITAGFSRAGGFGGDFRGGGPEGGGGDGGRTRSSTNTVETPKLTTKDLMIIRSNPNISYVNGIVSGRGEMVFLAETTNATIQGVDPNTWTQTIQVTLASGRLLSASDSTAIVIGNRLANSTFKEPLTIGRKITIEDKPFTVVGILAPAGTGLGFGGGDSTVYMTQNSAWNTIDVNRDVFSSIQAKASSADIVETVTDELTQSLLISRKVTTRSQNFSVTSSQAIKEQITSVTQTLTLFLGAIAAVSLIVGAIGVANSMFTSVLEKTKEIGILKALGTTNNEILTIFIMESGLFGLLGGIIGVIIGMLISEIISGLGVISIPMIRGGAGGTLVSPQLIIIAIFLSTVIGIISGVMPARAASKMKPVDALRYE
ncbi:MAG: ABC transporter permease [Candidatus Diapherotrites archaeon]|nr:ABC transporter permease [Candidatus Diapherotrites archaeon]